MRLALKSNLDEWKPIVHKLKINFEMAWSVFSVSKLSFEINKNLF